MTCTRCAHLVEIEDRVFILSREERWAKSSSASSETAQDKNYPPPRSVKAEKETTCIRMQTFVIDASSETAHDTLNKLL